MDNLATFALPPADHLLHCPQHALVARTSQLVFMSHNQAKYTHPPLSTSRPNLSLRSPRQWSRAYASSEFQRDRPRSVEEMKPLTSFFLPRVDAPFPYKCHRDYQTMKGPLNRYILDLQLPQTEIEREIILQSRFPLLCASVFPEALSDRLWNASMLVLWTFIVDNRVDSLEDIGTDPASVEEIISQHLAFLESGERNFREEKCLLPLSDVWRSIQSHSSPFRRKQLATGIVEYLRSCREVTLARQNEALPTVEEFIKMRVDGLSAMKLCLSLIEYALGISLDLETLDSEEIQELHDICQRHASFTNDLFSFRKEFYDGDLFANLPAILWANQDISFQQAIVKTCSMIESEGLKYIEVVKRIQQSPLINKPGMQRYLDGCGYLMSGNLHWLWESCRYHGLGWVPPSKPPTGIFRLHPHRTILEPITTSS